MSEAELTALRAQAEALYGLGDLRGSLAAYRRLIEQRPDDPELLSDAGTVCFALGEYEQSGRYYVRALAASPDHAGARQSLQMLCRASGISYEKALQEALAAGSSAPPAERDISVVVPANSDFDVLDRCLDALYSQTFPAERYEVLVVANGLTHESAHELADVLGRWRAPFGDRMRVFELEPASIALARNEGIGNARGRVVLQINQDTLLSRTALEQHWAEHQGFGLDPRCVVVGARIFPEQYLTSLFNYLHEAIPLYTALHRPGQRFLADHTWFITCNLSALRESYERFGVYDPTYMWGSDQELGSRWERDHRARIHVNTDIVSYHLHWLTFDSWRAKLVTGAPHWFRRNIGMGMDELAPHQRRALRKQRDATNMDPRAVEQELRRIESNWRGPDAFAGETVMGAPVFTVDELVHKLRVLLRTYRMHLRYSAAAEGFEEDEDCEVAAQAAIAAPPVATR